MVLLSWSSGFFVSPCVWGLLDILLFNPLFFSYFILIGRLTIKVSYSHPLSLFLSLLEASTYPVLHLSSLPFCCDSSIDFLYQAENQMFMKFSTWLDIGVCKSCLILGAKLERFVVSFLSIDTWGAQLVRLERWDWERQLECCQRRSGWEVWSK